jgi:hypothetical protein
LSGSWFGDRRPALSAFFCAPEEEQVQHFAPAGCHPGCAGYYPVILSELDKAIAINSCLPLGGKHSFSLNSL